MLYIVDSGLPFKRFGIGDIALCFLSKTGEIPQSIILNHSTSASSKHFTSNGPGPLLLTWMSHVYQMHILSQGHGVLKKLLRA